MLIDFPIILKIDSPYWANFYSVFIFKFLYSAARKTGTGLQKLSTAENFNIQSVTFANVSYSKPEHFRHCRYSKFDVLLYSSGQKSLTVHAQKQVTNHYYSKVCQNIANISSGSKANLNISKSKKGFLRRQESLLRTKTSAHEV